jgi:hypothetical protein
MYRRRGDVASCPKSAWRPAAPRLQKIAGPLIFRGPRRVGARGDLMAKDRKRGNREARKPKANKTPAAAAPASLMTKGASAVAPVLKKKS